MKNQEVTKEQQSRITILEGIIERLREENKQLLQCRNAAVSEVSKYHNYFFRLQGTGLEETRFRSRSFEISGRYFMLPQEDQIRLIKENIIFAIREMNNKITHEDILLEFLKK